MKVSTEIDNNFGYEKITQLVDNIPLRFERQLQIILSINDYHSIVFFFYFEVRNLFICFRHEFDADI
jgi:hypothetical protein